MNTIRFEIAWGDIVARQVVNIHIDGRNLIDWAKELELLQAQSEGAPELAGSYAPMPIEFFVKYMRGTLNSDHWANLFSCKDCEEVGCWSLQVRIESEGDAVVWTEFRQPHRPNWRYRSLGPFRFERTEYERALNELETLSES